MYVLAEQAARDLESILEESAAEWGPVVARRTNARLLRQFERIGSKVAVGHRRRDLPPHSSSLLFVTEKPFLIAFQADSRVIVRIIHGRRDLPRLFSG